MDFLNTFVSNSLEVGTVVISKEVPSANKTIFGVLVKWMISCLNIINRSGPKTLPLDYSTLY